MLTRLLRKGFGVALWTTDKELYVRVRYKNKELRVAFPIDEDVDKAMLTVAIKMANCFPDLVNVNDLK